MHKAKRGKGAWLREIAVERGPAIESRPGMPAAERKRQVAAFVEWAKTDSTRWEDTFDIRRVIKRLKPDLLAYLRSEGFERLSDSADFLGKSEGREILAAEAFDAYPVVYAAWQSIQLIACIESALACGDVTHACGFAARLGEMIEEARALSAWPRFARENRTGKRSALHDIVLDAQKRLLDHGWTDWSLRMLVGEMRKDMARVRARPGGLAGKFDYLDRGKWKPFPRRFAATVSDWRKKSDWPVTVRGKV